MIDKIFSNRIVIALFLTYFFSLFYYSRKAPQIKEQINQSKQIIFVDSVSNPIDICSGIDMKWNKAIYSSGVLYDLHQLDRTEDLQLFISDSLMTEKLNLSSSNLNKIPEELFKFSNLKELDISNNPFFDKNQLFKDLGKLENLKVLICRNCNLWSLPNSISELVNIEVLVLDRNGLSEVNEKIGELSNLKLLSFRNNSRLRDLPKSIGDLVCLQELNISGAGFTRIRDEVTECKNLKSILGNASKIKSIPDSIGKLTELRNLNLGYNEIEIIPESIGNLTKLEYLGLGSNELVSLPNSFSNLKNLKRLSISYNRFKNFPIEIIKLDELYTLSVNNSLIDSIPIVVAKMPRLKYLYLDHERITDDNIESLLKENPNLEVKRHDALRLAPSKPKRKQ